MLMLDEPRDSDTHTYGDFAELLCLLTADRTCSRDSIADFVRDSTGKRIREEQLDDAFAQLRWRVNAFGAFYPFTLDEHVRVLTGIEQLSASQRAYAFLLLCANLPYVPNVELGALADAFERAALCALKRLWPTKSEVRAFGKNETQYVGAKWERITRLALDIGGRPTVKADTYRNRDSGDGGIDLVAWLDLDGFEKENIPSGLAQCACSRSQWPTKQGAVSAFKIGAQLGPTHPWMTLMFIPQSFRNNLGQWAVDGEIGATVLVDRLRLLQQLDAEADLATIAPPPTFENFLAERLPLV